jgi:formylglycine-generating enzyme required for sulfatase activity
MVRVPLGYCVDRTEVTRAAYAAWLETTPQAERQSQKCVWNESFVPYRNWPAPELNPSTPVTWVDWCDADAYCRGVGKRLCSELPKAAEARRIGLRSQLSLACATSAENLYPYGNDYDEAACNGFDARNGAPVPVATMKRCQSSAPGYAGVYDLSGNVSEWEDSCLDEAGSGQHTFCRVRGGSFALIGEFLTCHRHQVVTRGNPAADIGFRCCAP